MAISNSLSGFLHLPPLSFPFSPFTIPPPHCQSLSSLETEFLFPWNCFCLFGDCGSFLSYVFFFFSFLKAYTKTQQELQRKQQPDQDQAFPPPHHLLSTNQDKLWAAWGLHQIKCKERIRARGRAGIFSMCFHLTLQPALYRAGTQGLEAVGRTDVPSGVWMWQVFKIHARAGDLQGGSLSLLPKGLLLQVGSVIPGLLAVRVECIVHK